MLVCASCLQSAFARILTPRLSGSLSLDLNLWPNLAANFPDDAELAGSRLQNEVVFLGVVLELLSVCCPLLQRVVAFSRQRWAATVWRGL